MDSLEQVTEQLGWDSIFNTTYSLTDFEAQRYCQNEHNVTGVYSKKTCAYGKYCKSVRSTDKGCDYVKDFHEYKSIRTY